MPASILRRCSNGADHSASDMHYLPLRVFVSMIIRTLSSWQQTRESFLLGQIGKTKSYPCRLDQSCSQ